jgi:hypothetical protein
MTPKEIAEAYTGAWAIRGSELDARDVLALARAYLDLLAASEQARTEGYRAGVEAGTQRAIAACEAYSDRYRDVVRKGLPQHGYDATTAWGAAEDIAAALRAPADSDSGESRGKQG